MKDVVVYTANVGNYDTLRPPKLVEDSVDYICFVEEVGIVLPDPWIAVCLPPDVLKDISGPQRQSRCPKINSCRFFADEYRYSIWHDANFSILKPAMDLLDKFLDSAGSDIAFYIHPHRKTVGQEATACIALLKDRAPAIVEHLDSLNKRGVPKNLQLLSGGIILRRYTDKVREFDTIWWDEFVSGCSRDQIGLPYALWKSGISYTVIHEDYFMANPYFDYSSHRRAK